PGGGPVGGAPGAPWGAAAMTDGDREAAGGGVIDAEGFRVRLLAVHPEAYRLDYGVLSNQTLWFVSHALSDLPRVPAFGAELREAWQAYRQVNDAFAAAVAEVA